MLQKKLSTSMDPSEPKTSTEDLLKLYNKEYHEGHLSWAKDETPIYHHYRDNYMRLVQPEQGLKVLEIGCSAGKTSVELARRGCKVVAVDFDQNAIDLASQFAKDSGVAENIEFVCSSADSEELMKHDFDRVTMLDFVEHVPDDILRNILSNLKNKPFNGDICIYTPDRHHFTERLAKLGVIHGDATHINLKSRKEWIAFLTECGFKIKNLKRETTHWPVLRNIEQLVNSLPMIGGLFTRSIAVRGNI